MTRPNTESNKAPLTSKGANAPTLQPVLKPEYSVILDWCRYTMKRDPDMPIADALRVAIPRDPAFQLTGEMTSNAKGYDSAQKLTLGIVHWHSTIPSQGISVELSGSSLAAMRAASVSETFLLHHVSAVLAQVSTLDAALDIYNSGGHHRDFITARDNGTLETSARSIGEHAASVKVDGKWIPEGTVYVGSAKSPRQIKIYDKAREQKLMGRDWIRIEMRWRGKHARAAHDAMLKFGIAPTLRAAILSMVNLPKAWFRDAMKGEIALIEPVRRPETDTDKWLIELVAPLLERRLANERAEGGSTLFDAFDGILRAEFSQRGKNTAQRRANGLKRVGVR